MKVEFRNSFAKDLKSIRDQALLERVRETIEETERAKSPSEISNLKKLKGRGDYYVFVSGIIGSALYSQKVCLFVS